MEHSDPKVSFLGIDFNNYKGFGNFSLRLQQTNILVGPNNCGKSTIIGAFRILDVGLRRARTKRPELVQGPEGATWGYRLSLDSLPVSLENVHTNYAELDSIVTFTFSNNNRLVLYFAAKREGCTLIPYVHNKSIRSPSSFKNSFPVDIALVPVLGPLEHDEELVTEETVERYRSSHRASRHFRNYWYHFRDGFNDFAELVNKTWPKMTIQLPVKVDPITDTLHMFCLEDRITRELYWSGFGFQVWCQMLTHAARARDATIFVVDEPEIYLHPDVQRQLLGILRDLGPDLLLATHSTEIMSEADPSEILVIDKNRRRAQRLRDIQGLQAALELIGSVQNITLTRLARNRRILFVEDDYDFGVLRQFARKVALTELAAGTDITAVPSGGFSSWDRVKATGWGLRKTIGSVLLLGAVYDRDYRCGEEIRQITDELNKDVALAVILERKEIENYLLMPSALQRALESSVREACARTSSPLPEVESIDGLLREITEDRKHYALGQYIDHRVRFLRSDHRHAAAISGETSAWFEKKWNNLESRLEIVPGKEILSALRRVLQDRYSVTLTDARIIRAFKPDEVPEDLLRLLHQLDDYRKRKAPTISG